MISYQDSSKFIFFETLLRRKQRRLFWKSFFISLFFYVFLSIVVIVFMNLLGKKPQVMREEVILVGRAQYLPIPEVSEVKKQIEDSKTEKINDRKKAIPDAPVIAKETDNESDFGWKYRTQEKIDTSWREKVANLTTPKKKEDIKPIEVSKSKSIEEDKKAEKIGSNIGNEDEKEVFLYSRKMQTVIRNHWSVPEDLAIKYGNKPVEVEIEIDINGSLKNYRLKNSSGNSLYDASIKEAIRKSFPFLPPPKNLFPTPFENAKITIIFRL
ncbi:MAG: TonB C-terminal domain-containing protein [Proteobacteria bacterium]|nr:TonB C-terminal domain-containing protein [Pseudomonadota bacterium]